MRQAKFCASTPHHVTALFDPSINPANPLLSGSRGVGLAVEPRLVVCENEDWSESIESLGPTARRVAELLNVANATVRYVRPLPPGVGFAVSGATATAVALALGSSRGFNVLRSLQIAHTAEVLEGSGLGDVLAISCGIGLVFRFKAGAPGVGEVDCAQVPSSVAVLAIAFRVMETREFLRVFAQSEVSQHARARLEAILGNPTLDSFIENLSRFNAETGILRKTLGESLSETVEKLPGLIVAYVKKGVLAILLERDRVSDAYEALRRHNMKVYLLEPSRSSLQIWSS
ncbi:MAG: hypothetical protein QXS85_00130 [Acidilobaceae archaeon]